MKRRKKYEVRLDPSYEDYSSICKFSVFGSSITKGKEMPLLAEGLIDIVYEHALIYNVWIYAKVKEFKTDVKLDLQCKRLTYNGRLNKNVARRLVQEWIMNKQRSEDNIGVWKGE